MIELTHTIAGDTCTIHTPERADDLGAFWRWLESHPDNFVFGADSETTGLDIYSLGFRLRLFQIGDGLDAWVLDAEQFRLPIIEVLRSGRNLAFHNFAFDGLVFDRTLGVPFEELLDHTFDTRIWAHLLDPRELKDGGAGLHLKPLCAIYVDPAAPDTQDGLNAHFRELGFTKETGWALIDIRDELYLRYAGLDVILETRLFDALRPMIVGIGLDRLSTFEHVLQGCLMAMMRRGMLIDHEYLPTLDHDLSVEAATRREIARAHGVENINSTRQVAAALVAMGETLTERTKTGLKVDKEVLLPLADLDNLWERRDAREPNPLADAVLRGKRAEHWRTAYVQAFERLADPAGRLHATLGGLQARTARMSVSRPPLQQLPSSDWRVRRAIIADPGYLMFSADFDQIELRVMAALADIPAMKQAIADGRDLHDFTAQLVYGDGFTKKQRKLMKGVGFGKVYGGGAETLSRQTGADIDDVRRAVREYDRTYPQVRRFSQRLQRSAEFGKREVVTPSGRHLPLDRARLYAATNYMIQSTARDILAQCIVDLFDEGLGEYLLLPIHDEILGEFPEADAPELAAEVTRIMTRDFQGVPLTATAEVTGRSWGSAYGIPPELDYLAA